MRKYLKSRLVKTGIGLFVLGCGPLLAIILLDAVGLWPDPDPNPIGPGLLERHGMNKFQALYALTPLAPMQRDPGDSARWQQVYGESFETIVDAWLLRLQKGKKSP